MNTDLKARILYNHLWFSDLSEEFIDNIYKDRRYHNIINHKNFNPRLISFITDSQRISEFVSSNYWNYICDTLENPKGIWSNVFNIQLDAISKHLVIAVSLGGNYITEERIKSLYYELKKRDPDGNKYRPIESVLRVLTGSLLDRHFYDDIDYVSYTLFNPSIADFVISAYLEDIEYIAFILSCLKDSTAIESLKGLLKSDKKRKSTITAIIMKLVDHSRQEIITVDSYFLSLQQFIFDLKIPTQDFKEFNNSIINSILETPNIGIDWRLAKLTQTLVSFELIHVEDALVRRNSRLGFLRRAFSIN